MVGLRRSIYTVFPLVIICILMLAIIGCGSADEEEAAKEAEEEAAKEEAVAVENWINPTERSDIIDRFVELEYQWVNYENGVEVDSTVVSYKDEGTVSVDGVEARLTVFKFDDDVMKLWVDNEGNLVKGTFGGEELPGELADQAFTGMEQVAFMPFLLAEGIGVHEALTQENYPGMEWSALSTERKQFNGLQADVTRVQVDMSPPVTLEGEEATIVWGIGDFGDFQMLVEWDLIDEAGKDDFTFKMQVNKVAMR